MKKIVLGILLLGLLALTVSCTTGGYYGGVYRYHHGYGPWYGARGYYGYGGGGVIVTPPPDRPVEPAYEATTLPSGPGDMPDMGMPDIGDVGGYDDF
jgi:hypothetical protein